MYVRVCVCVCVFVCLCVLSAFGIQFEVIHKMRASANSRHLCRKAKRPNSNMVNTKTVVKLEWLAYKNTNIGCAVCGNGHVQNSCRPRIHVCDSCPLIRQTGRSTETTPTRFGNPCLRLR